MTLFVASRPDEVLTPLYWVPVAHALVVGSTCAFTAVLLAGQATTSGRHGYLWLAGTYAYVAGILLMFPVFFPNAILNDGSLLGGFQSAPTLFYAWHLAFPIGLIVSIIELRRDQIPRSGRQRRIVVWHMAVVVAILLGLSFGAASAGSDLLPQLVLESGRLTDLSAQLDDLVFGVTLLSVIIAVIAAYRGTHIQRWLVAVAMLLLGESVVNMSATGRWTFAWYFDRLFGMVALSALFLALLVIVANAGRATTIIAGSDSLTGIESRARFTKAVDDALTRADGAAVALLWVDLDGFKSINDELGHAFGDEVLRISARRIESQVRDPDHVGRLGGDEFGVLLCGVMDSEIEAIAERICVRMREPLTISDATTLMSSSIGIAVAPSDAQTTQDLVLRADLAMYAAKHAGGDRWTHFTSTLGEDALNRAQLRHRISQAVRECEFDLDVQPIVIGESGDLIGYEALIRWQQGSERIAADQFVSFAERSGQIIQVGRTVIGLLERSAAHLLTRLPSNGFVAFNMSAKEIADQPLVERLTKGQLAQLADRIVVEVTESQELLRSAEVREHLSALRSAHYRIALDDFGAGFSNFSRLEHLHPQLLKIDRLVVRQAAAGGSGGLSFLSAALGVADSLGCDVVVEGVETEQQARIVASLPVAYAQGEWFGKPAALGEVLGPVPLADGTLATDGAGEPRTGIARSGDGITDREALRPG